MSNPDLGNDDNMPYDDGPRGLGSMSPANDPVFEFIGICHKCTHRATLYTCSAFPDGIPARIMTGKFLHTKSYAGDHGIQFSPK
jgi:hypothetical protein